MRYFLLIIFFPILIYSQTQDNDSLWNFDDLGELEIEEVQSETGKGFFPGVPSGINLFGIHTTFSGLYTVSKGMSYSRLPNTNYSYSAITIEELDKFETNESWRETGDASELTRSHIDLGLSFLHSNFLPFFVNGALGVTFSSDFLAQRIGENPFLSGTSGLNYFEEYSVLTVSEINLTPSIGVLIPIYGGYIKMNQGEIFNNTTGSFYYLSVSYSPLLVVNSTSTQYNIITTNKDRIRYDSGRDTLRFGGEFQFDDLVRLRNNINIGIGFMTFGDNFGLEQELYIGIPLDDVIEGQNWKQYSIGFVNRIRFRWW